MNHTKETEIVILDDIQLEDVVGGAAKKKAKKKATKKRAKKKAKKKAAK